MKPATTLDHTQLRSNPSSSDSRLEPLCDSQFTPLEIDLETQSQILDLFIAGQMDLASIAALCNITFTQLIDFLESPRIVARLDAIQRLSERRAALMAAEARCVALARLRTIADHQPERGFTPPKLFTRELETTRKAAAQLLRLNPPPGEGWPAQPNGGGLALRTKPPFPLGPLSRLATSPFVTRAPGSLARASGSYRLTTSRPHDSRSRAPQATGAHLERHAPVCAAEFDESLGGLLLTDV